MSSIPHLLSSSLLFTSLLFTSLFFTSLLFFPLLFSSLFFSSLLSSSLLPLYFSPLLFYPLHFYPHLSSPLYFSPLPKQLEVAERIVAKPSTKQYGIPSVVFQLYAAPKINFKIPPSVFYPKPNVDSALLTLGCQPSLSRCVCACHPPPPRYLLHFLLLLSFPILSIYTFPSLLSYPLYCFPPQFPFLSTDFTKPHPELHRINGDHLRR